MRLISLSRGYTAQVDDEDYERLSKHSWHIVSVPPVKVYAAASINRKKIRMHRFILNVTDQSVFIDHADRDTLNNQKSNLRIATIEQNNWNRKPQKNKKSKYKGVSFRKNKWVARITINNKLIDLGSFESEEQAALAYDKKAIELFKDFAYLNFKQHAA